MKRLWARWSRPTVLAALLMMLPACSTSGLAFSRDMRLEITSPQNNSTQRLPFTIRWTIKDFTVTGPDGSARAGAGYFAVFLDRAPQPPGKSISYLAKSDEQCRRRQACPDAQWFTDHHIFPTTSTQFVVDALPTFTKEELQRFHEVTVVLLDGKGDRIGESAFSVQFKVAGSP